MISYEGDYPEITQIKPPTGSKILQEAFAFCSFNHTIYTDTPVTEKTDSYIK